MKLIPLQIRTASGPYILHAHPDWTAREIAILIQRELRERALKISVIGVNQNMEVEK